jgi:class 3 adenylate cyclase
MAVTQWVGVEIGPVAITGGLRDQSNQGFICGVTPNPMHRTANQELLEHLANALGQRLVDYHKDRRYLQHFFSPQDVSCLLSERNYQATYLTPALRQVAILYTDINSFTKISEQILETPQEVGQLVDYWAQGVVEILFAQGGMFDKMVGDCVIGLFGPPFYEDSPQRLVAQAVRAAVSINEYTQNLRGARVVDKICQSSLIPGLGVATGVNYGDVMVGTFGPNQDFTAFGRPMNNTARLQGVAGFRQTLVMDRAYQILQNGKDSLLSEYSWGDVMETQVKNVQDPLVYRSVSLTKPS